MNLPRTTSVCLLAVAFVVSLLAGQITRHDYAHQFRESANAAPSRQFLLGTDELGRDRLARLLYGTRVSLLLAPAAALFSVLLAGIVGGIAGYRGGWPERILMTVTNLFLSLPWLFVLVAARGLLPLNLSPIFSMIVTFALLGLMGWAASARVICGGARSVRHSAFVLQAHATGARPFRIVLFQVLPTLRPALVAQFWLSIPVFILAEANLGLLGLGVAEPMPSWGGLLRELERPFGLVAEPWRLAPLVTLVLVVIALQVAVKREEVLA